MVSRQLGQIIANSLATREQSSGPVVELGERRKRMHQGADRMPTPPGVSVETVDADGVPCEWIKPATITDARVILYFHGGGYVNGSLDTHRKMLGFLAGATGLAVLSVGYRLAPEHPFPAALDDGVRALTWLTANKVPSGDVVIAGDSAGGGLVLAVTTRVRDAGSETPGAMVLLSPWVEMAPDETPEADAAVDDPLVSRASLADLRDLYLGDVDPTSPLASPLRGDLGGLPRTLIQVGSREVLCAEAERLNQLLQLSDVDSTCEVWDGMVHVWHFYAGYAPEADAAFTSIAHWLHSTPRQETP